MAEGYRLGTRERGAHPLRTYKRETLRLRSYCLKVSEGGGRALWEI